MIQKIEFRPKEKLKEERKKSNMTTTEQITRLETAKTTAETQMEKYKTKVDNQKTEIHRLMEVVDKLTAEKTRKQTAIEDEAEKHAKADKAKDDKINSLSKVNAQLEENLKDVNERFELTKKKLEEAAEDREHLRIQVANSVADRSQTMMAMELTSGFNKLVDQVFGANKAGGDGKSVLETLQCEVSKLEDNISHMKECQICFNPFDNDTRVPAKGKCPHAIYCMACLRMLVKTKKNAQCPTCRLPLKGDDIVPVKLNFV
jgi:chromosome segregation ATPase